MSEEQKLDEAYEYLSDTTNAVPVSLQFSGVSRYEALKIIEVLRWLESQKEKTQ